MDGCLTENVVAALVAGSVPRVELASIELHLDSCPPCRELVAHALHALHAPPRATPGARRIGRHRVLREVGTGSMGPVYAAEDPDLGRDVALTCSSAPRWRSHGRRAAMP